MINVNSLRRETIVLKRSTDLPLAACKKSYFIAPC